MSNYSGVHHTPLTQSFHLSISFTTANLSLTSNNPINATISPIPNKSWNFTTVLKILSVGKTRIDNSTNTTSLSLDGNGYLKQNVNSTKNLSALTLSAWVKPDYGHGSPQFTIISKENTFILAINNNIVPSKKAIFSVFDGIKWNTVASNSTIPENWTHLVATYDNSSIGIYVNGILESKIPLVGVPTISITGKIENQTGIISSSDSDVVIGAYLNSLRSHSSNLFSGSIQDVTLYNSTLNVMQINKIYLYNVSVFNPSYLINNIISTPVITNSQLNHTNIEINKPVIWIQNITLSKTTNLAIEMPSDAKILDANSTNPESKFATNISKFQTLNQTFNANTTIISNKIIPVASLNPQMIEENKTTKLLLLNDTAKQYQFKFQTPPPYTLETNKSSSDQFIKQVRVLNNSTLHYLDVKSYTSLPLDLVKKGVHFKLFWIINGTKIDVTNDPRFHVQFVDTNSDGLVDQMQWLVPHLSEQDFQVEEDNGDNHDNNHDCNNNDNNGNGNDHCNGHHNESSNHGNNNDDNENNNDNNGDNDNQDCNSQQFSIQLSETVGISDTAITPSTRNISLEENLGVSDTAITPSTRNVFLKESLGVSDVVPSTLHLAANQQLVVNTQKEIVINSTKTDLVITSSDANLTTITISSDVITSTLNYSSIVKTNSTSSTVSIVNGLTILQNTTSGIPKIQVTLPSDLIMTSIASWNGVLSLPHVISAPSIPTETNTVNTVTSAIEIGSDNVSLTFNKSVRIVFTGQAGQRVGYFSSTIPFTEITTICNDDTQITNNNLPLGGSCKINSGHDLVIWTKHFTGFATWSSSTVSTTSAQASTPASSYGGGGGTGIGFGSGTYSASSSGAGAGPYLKIEKISYDTCDKQIATIQVATDVSGIDPMVIVRTSLVGVVSAQLLANQPFAQENSNSIIQHLVYQTSLSLKETSFEVVALESINHNIFSVGKTVIVNGCGENLDFTQTELTVSPVPIDLSTPKIFDVRAQVENGTKQPAESVQFVDNQPITVYSIIDTKTPIKHAYLRFVKLGQNESKYDETSMDITPILISNSTYTVSGTIPAGMMLSPAMKYWIHIENQDKQVDSSQYEIAIKPQYVIAGKLDLYVISNRAGGTVATPVAFFTNNSTGPIYGSVTLIVDGNQVYESPLNIFDPGLTKINLKWNSPSTDKILSHSIQAQAKFYDEAISSQQFNMNTFPSTKTVFISNLIDVQSITDDKGNVIAVPDNIYSSHLHETGVSFRVIAPDGTCVIGNNCLVSKSTYDLSDQVMKITIGEQIYRIRYSGPEAALERFTISSVDPILGHWNVELESNGGIMQQAQAMEKIPLKIKYRILDTSGLQ